MVSTAQIAKYLPLIIVGILIPLMQSYESTGTLTIMAVVAVVLAFLIHEFEPEGSSGGE